MTCKGAGAGVVSSGEGAVDEVLGCCERLLRSVSLGKCCCLASSKAAIVFSNIGSTCQIAPFIGLLPAAVVLTWPWSSIVACFRGRRSATYLVIICQSSIDKTSSRSEGFFGGLFISERLPAYLAYAAL